MNATSPTAHSARPLVMLVDDEPDILVALQDLLEDRYSLIACGSPDEALARLEAGARPAAIVSDQRMPGMTGDVFLAKARAIVEAPAILLTGYADFAAVTSALNAGGIVGYAAKPWEPEALRAMVAGAVEQHALRAALSQARTLLGGLMEHLPAGVTFKDAAGAVLQANARSTVTLESTGGEREARATGRPVQTVTEYPGPAGSTWVEAEYVPLGGEAGYLAIIERDVTEQRVLEAQLRQADKLRALGTLAGGVAHDFNNLLTAILGSLELASRRIGDEAAVRRYLEGASLAAGKGAALTQRLLGFSRQNEARTEVVDIADALVAARELAARTAGPAVTLQWRTAGDLWHAQVESDQFELALINLVANARDAMPDGGQILIDAANVSLAPTETPPELIAGDYVAVAVRDTGHGMAPEVIARILEPFFTTKPIGKGTGLGLPMVYAFAQRSGGGMTISSDLGRGTTMTLYLPRADQAPSCGVEPVAAAGDSHGGFDILVVDDEAGVREITVGLLRDLGHRPWEADCGDAALALLKGRAVDVVLADYAMPGMTGAELATAVRANWPQIPVVLLTGYLDLDAAPTGLPVLRKPFKVEDLDQALRRTVGAREAAP